MANQDLFEVVGIEKLIEGFSMNSPITQNSIYYIDPNFNDCENAKNSMRMLGILLIPEVKEVNYYLGHIKTVKDNKHRGVVFTDGMKKLGIFLRPGSAKVNEDYLLVLRNENEVLYRGGILPGRGYQVEKLLTLIPGTPFSWPDLSNPQVRYPNHKPDLLPYVAGKSLINK